jgi:hypothetical protein
MKKAHDDIAGIEKIRKRVAGITLLIIGVTLLITL